MRTGDTTVGSEARVSAALSTHITLHSAKPRTVDHKSARARRVGRLGANETPPSHRCQTKDHGG
jgi:hypothetical protein